MQRQMACALVLALCAGIGMAAAPAKAQKKITIRVLDGRNGDRVVPNNLEVRINRENTLHVEWVKLHDDGTAEVTLPDSATAFAVRATYENSTEYYVNCDVARQKDTSAMTWFPVDDVLKDGLVMPNECWKSKDVERNKFPVSAGEFVLLVRKRSIRDQVPVSLPY
jgi:hypothetical protein